MKVTKKIKEILKQMIDDGEFEKIIKCKGYTMKERKLSKQYYDAIKNRNIDELPIQELLLIMPRPIAIDVLAYLMQYEIKTNK